jgi:hypothetical protein
MRNYFTATFAILATVTVTVAPAWASMVYDLNVISAANIGTGVQGTVTLTQNGADEVDVAVKLSQGVLLVNTGGPHSPFVFNLAPSVAGATVTVTSPSTFYTPGSTQETPFGTFTNGIAYSGANGGGSGSPGPLDFMVVDLGGISIGDFVANTGGYFFAADILGTGGYTGAVASNAAVTPLPPAWSVMLIGLAGIASLVYRRQKQGTSFAAA